MASKKPAKPSDKKVPFPPKKGGKGGKKGK